MKKSKYADWTKEELIKRIEALEKRKKYGLVWEEEKTKEKFEADAEGKLPVLIEDKKKEIKTDADKPTHILIEGDNYHALSVLNYTHAKSIDVMYFDPPYNTGNNDFKYNDKFVDREDSYRHSKWLSFMGKRLKLAKRLLKDSGVIFISIDDNEFAQLKLLCDEIFLEENYIGTIVRRRRQSQANLSKNMSTIHEYLLCYGKSKKVVLSKIYPTLDETDFKNPDNDSRGPYVTMPCSNKGGALYEIKTPTGEKYTEEWRFKEETFRKLKEENKIVFPKSGDGKPRYKLFLNEKQEKGTIPNTWWDDVASNQEATRELKEFFKGELIFNNPKPVQLIKQVIKLASGSKGIILDFFAGTGTTGQAVLEINKEDKGKRQFILCTNDENKICTEVCYPRVKKVIEGYKNLKGEKIEGLGGNLKYYKTDFVGSEPTHRNKKLLTDKSIEMLCVKENTFEEVVNKKDIFIFKSKEKFTAILFDEMKMEEFKNEIKKLKMPVSVYVFSLEGDDFKEEFENFKNDITLCSIPEAILKVYRRIYGAGQMKLKV